MEPDIPSELDIADSCTDGRGIGQYTTELKSTLVLKVIGTVSGDGMSKSRILAVLREGIVQGSNLTLCVAVFLHRIGHVVILCGKECDSGHARGESTGYVGSRECLQRG